MHPHCVTVNLFRFLVTTAEGDKQIPPLEMRVWLTRIADPVVILQGKKSILTLKEVRRFAEITNDTDSEDSSTVDLVAAIERIDLHFEAVPSEIAKKDSLAQKNVNAVANVVVCSNVLHVLFGLPLFRV